MDVLEPEEPKEPLTGIDGKSPWAQWEYTSEEWRLFEQRDWQSTMSMFLHSMRELVRLYLILAVGVVLLLLILTVGGMVPVVSPLFFGVEALGVAMAMLLVIPILAMTDVLQLLNAWMRHLARRKEVRRVIIGGLTSSGKQAVWVGGRCFPLQNILLRLEQAILYEDISEGENKQRDQPELHFSRRLGPLNLASIDRICVLVPTGHEEEARRLVERFNQETMSIKTKAVR